MDRRSVPLLLLALLWGACGSSEPSPTPKTLAAVGSTTLTGTVGGAITPAPSVNVTSSKGGAYAGATVTFTATGGTLTGETVTTDATGKATLGGWTLGTTAGTYTLTATVTGLTPVTFTATANPGAPSVVTVMSGGGQSAGVATAVPAPITVQVKDSYGNRIPNANVSFAVTAGGGSLAGLNGTTNNNGEVVLPAWTLGTSLGANTVTITAGSASTTVSATGQPGAPVALTAVAGIDQEGDVGTPLATPIGAKVADSYGNGVSGVTVNFTQASGGVQIGSASAVTNAQGIATTTVTLTAAGTSSVSAASPGLPSATFTMSTGPTITGQITLLPQYSGIPVVVAAGAGAAGGVNPKLNAAGLLRGLAMVEAPAALPSPTRLNGAAGAPTTRRLVVRFRSSDFGLPAQAAAYTSQSAVFSQATAAYTTVLAPHAQAQRVVTRAISVPLAAALVEVPADRSPEAVMAELRRDPRIADVAPDGVVSQHEHGSVTVPPEAELAARWGAHRVGSVALMGERYANDPWAAEQLWHYRMIDAIRVWPLTTGSPTVRVGVIDSGLRADHPAAAGMFNASQAFDFVDGITTAYSFAQPVCGGGTFLTFRGLPEHASSPRNAATDPMGYQVHSSGTCWEPRSSGSHGTHVAMTIASQANDGVAGSGVNWAATIVPIRALGVTGSGSWFDISQAILYAGGLCATYVGAPAETCIQMPAVDVLNMSLGGGCEALTTAAMAQIVNSVVVVVSMGNNNNSTPQCPASLPGVVAVTALGPSYAKAGYSSFGAHATLSAPGGDLTFGTTHGVMSAAWNYHTMEPIRSFWHGTSMASPHVAGVAALVKAANPGFTADQIRARLISGAVDRGTPGHDATYGHGVVNAYRSVTGNSAPPQSTRVRAVDVATGAIVKTVAVAGNGSFQLTRLPAGTYRIVATQDEDGDGLLGLPGRRFGAAAATVTIGPNEVKTASFSIGDPAEVEPNNTMGEAQLLVVDSWVQGALSTTADRDVYEVRIPTAGSYTFETSGVLGTCGSAGEADTNLRLMGSDGGLLAENDDTPYPVASVPGVWCSKIVQTLSPGTYYLDVGTLWVAGPGRYRLHVARSPS